MSIPKPLRVPDVFKTSPQAAVVYLPYTSKNWRREGRIARHALYEHPIISSDGPGLPEITLRLRERVPTPRGFYAIRFPGGSVCQFRHPSMVLMVRLERTLSASLALCLCHLGYMRMVLKAGLEPARLAAQEPESCASAKISPLERGTQGGT